MKHVKTYESITDWWKNRNKPQKTRTLMEPDPNCTDCKKGIDMNGEDRFMVNDEIWNQYVEDKGDTQICWNCLEKRIKRKLKYEDFSQYMKFPINSYNKKIQNLK